MPAAKAALFPLRLPRLFPSRPADGEDVFAAKCDFPSFIVIYYCVFARFYV